MIEPIAVDENWHAIGRLIEQSLHSDPDGMRIHPALEERTKFLYMSGRVKRDTPRETLLCPKIQDNPASNVQEPSRNPARIFSTEEIARKSAWCFAVTHLHGGIRQEDEIVAASPAKHHKQIKRYHPECCPQPIVRDGRNGGGHGEQNCHNNGDVDRITYSGAFPCGRSRTVPLRHRNRKSRAQTRSKSDDQKADVIRLRRVPQAHWNQYSVRR